MELTTHEDMRDLLPPRKQSRDANKGAFGTVLVIAGSHGMAGAACLSAVSALRAGAGLVMLAVPESLLDTAATLAPEVILRALPETPEKTHGGPGAIEAALALAEKADAVAIGPGLSSGNTNVVSFVQALIAQIRQAACGGRRRIKRPRPQAGVRPKPKWAAAGFDAASRRNGPTFKQADWRRAEPTVWEACGNAPKNTMRSPCSKEREP